MCTIYNLKLFSVVFQSLALKDAEKNKLFAGPWGDRTLLLTTRYHITVFACIFREYVKSRPDFYKFIQVIQGQQNAFFFFFLAPWGPLSC